MATTTTTVSAAPTGAPGRRALAPARLVSAVKKWILDHHYSGTVTSSSCRVFLLDSPALDALARLDPKLREAHALIDLRDLARCFGYETLVALRSGFVFRAVDDAPPLPRPQGGT
jgi:hypothetical protein